VVVQMPGQPDIRMATTKVVENSCLSVDLISRW